MVNNSTNNNKTNNYLKQLYTDKKNPQHMALKVQV